MQAEEFFLLLRILFFDLLHQIMGRDVKGVGNAPYRFKIRLFCAGIVLYLLVGIPAFAAAETVIDGRAVLLFFAKLSGLVIGTFL